MLSAKVRGRALGATTAVLVASSAGAALAQGDIKPSTAIAMACSDVDFGQSVSYARFASAVATAAGVTPADLQAVTIAELKAKGASPEEIAAKLNAMSPSDYDRATLSVLRAREVPGRSKLTNNLLMLVASTEALLADNSDTKAEAAGLRVEAAGRGPKWLFAPDERRLTCLLKPASDPIPRKTTFPLVAIRGEVSGLGLSGEDRKTADAFKLGFKREIKEQDDGSNKTDRTETFDGVIGLRLTKADASTPVYAYGDYTLSRARSKPQAPLDPGEAVDDGDTNAWEIGFSSAGKLFYNEDMTRAVLVDTRLGWVGDDIKGSRRAVLGLGATPSFAIPDKAPCGFGGFADQSLGALKFRVRCRVRVEGEASYVDDVGKADFKKYGKFVAVGATLGFDIAPPMGDDAGVITSVSYRYLPVISGRAPDVHRFDASVKYRFWLDSGLGVDLGLTYGKGRETKTYKDEDKIEAGLGVLF